MESQPPAKKRREEEEGGDDDDRISGLPLPILHHHILTRLPQKDAVRTSILSKSWRHLGPTRPKFEFYLRYYPETKFPKFASVLNKSLQRYVDQNLSIQEFVLEVEMGPKSISLLNKWIPIVIMNLGVKKFNLKASHYSLPSFVFQAQLLTELYLEVCKLDQINNNNNFIVKLPMLKRLSLARVKIEKQAFEKIMSSCPLIEHLVIKQCTGLMTIKLNKATNLKHFDCNFFPGGDEIIEIDDSSPLETLRIQFCHNWHSLCNYFFPRLKSLYLGTVRLPKELLNILSSNNCPCLEELQLHDCYGITEFKLSNRSIKRLIIDISIIKADIDAANMLYFEFESWFSLPSISFSSISSECKSLVHAKWLPWDPDTHVWPLKLYEFLKALSLKSQVSLGIVSKIPLKNQETYGGGGGEPVVIEHLCFMHNFLSSSLPVLLNCLFRTCRPRYIDFSFNILKEKENESQLAGSILKILLNQWRTRQDKDNFRQCHFWQHDLEKVSIQVSDKKTNEWHPVQDCALSNNQSIRFGLKWRDLS